MTIPPMALVLASTLAAQDGPGPAEQAAVRSGEQIINAVLDREWDSFPVAERDRALGVLLQRRAEKNEPAVAAAAAVLAIRLSKDFADDPAWATLHSDRFARFLKSPSPGIRIAGLRALAYLSVGSRRHLDAIRACLRDPEASGQAFLTLAAVRGREGIEEILEFVERRADFALHRNALDALERTCRGLIEEEGRGSLAPALRERIARAALDAARFDQGRDAVLLRLANRLLEALGYRPYVPEQKPGKNP